MTHIVGTAEIVFLLTLLATFAAAFLARRHSGLRSDSGLADRSLNRWLGFSRVLFYIAALAALGFAPLVYGFVLPLLGGTAIKSEVGIPLLIAGILGAVAISCFQASVILKKARSEVYDSQAFQTFQFTVRVFNVVHGLISLVLLVNMAMLFFIVIVSITYLLLVIVTLGSIWFEKDVTWEDMIYIPKSFFEWELTLFTGIGLNEGQVIFLFILITVFVLVISPLILSIWIMLKRKQLQE